MDELIRFDWDPEQGILTVRFTLRMGVIRIIGAGFWRKGKARYERENALYR